MNKNYERGRRFEYKIKTFFMRRGYYVTRSAGSHGAADLVALKRGKRPLLIQCKYGSGGISMEEQNELYKTAVETDGIAIVASSDERQPTVFKRVVGAAIKKDGSTQIVKERMFK